MDVVDSPGVFHVGKDRFLHTFRSLRQSILLLQSGVQHGGKFRNFFNWREKGWKNSAGYDMIKTNRPDAVYSVSGQCTGNGLVFKRVSVPENCEWRKSL